MLPDVQLKLRAGVVEFAWGHPDLALLPVDGLASAAELALHRSDRDALSYGAVQGPGVLIEQIRARLARIDGEAPRTEQLFITGGVSQALDLLCTLLTLPGEPILVESPVYHLALRTFHDHGLQIVPVAADEQGLQPDALQDALAALERTGRRARLLYTVPTFGNPSGATLQPERREALVALAERAGLTILEDDVYRELWYDAPPPPALSSLFGQAPLSVAPVASGAVVRLGSFSKILAPGLRLGWLLAPPEIIQRCTGCGLLDSGGGINHFTAHVVAAFMELGLLDGQVAQLRQAYRARRDTLNTALAGALPGECRWHVPGGGFFIWVRLPDGLDSSAMLPTAEAAGVSYVPGAPFSTESNGRSYLRLAFTLLPFEQLVDGARRLGAVIRAAQGE